MQAVFNTLFYNIMIHNFFGNPDKNKMEIETDFKDPEHDKKPWIEKYRPMNLS